MKRTPAFAVVLGLIILLPVSALTAPDWSFDPVHGSIEFKVKHTLGFVTGVFEQYNGTIRFDPEDLAGSSMTVEIKIDSINTRFKKRDQHLLSGDFFDAKKYPIMKFVSSEIAAKGDNEYIAKGTLTIKDVSKDIELPFKYLGTVPHPFNDKQLIAGFDAQYSLDRLAYNVGSGEYYKKGVVGKDIDITLHFELIRDK